MNKYRHLGGLLHHSGDLLPEIRQRVALAHGAVNQHRRLLYQNHHISLAKRVELFRMLVLSKLLYGADSSLEALQATLRLRHDEHASDDEILCRVALPSPAELLRIARLRYFATLVHSNLEGIWATLALDDDWRGLLEEDIDVDVESAQECFSAALPH